MLRFSLYFFNFGRDDLKEKANVQESMFKLLHAVKDNKFISLNPPLYLYKIIQYFEMVNLWLVCDNMHYFYAYNNDILLILS